MGIPPKVTLFPGINSVKKYAKSGWCGAAASKSKRRGERNMLSVYHASERSKSESPVWNGPPSVGSFAG